MKIRKQTSWRKLFCVWRRRIPGNYCNHCIEECDHITYNAIIKKEPGINKDELFKKDYETGKCTGEKVFCDFFRPDSSTNGTLIDRGVENAYNYFNYFLSL